MGFTGPLNLWSYCIESQLTLISLTWDCTTFHSFFSVFKINDFQKLAGLYHHAFIVGFTGPLNLWSYCIESQLTLIRLTWDCTTFHSFFSVFKINDFQKLAGLWLFGEVVNHVGIYGSKAAEGFSAFQRRSCFLYILGHICGRYNCSLLNMCIRLEDTRLEQFDWDICQWLNFNPLGSMSNVAVQLAAQLPNTTFAVQALCFPKGPVSTSTNQLWLPMIFKGYWPLPLSEFIPYI